MKKKSCALPRSVFPLKFKVRSPAHALELARELIRPFRHWTTGELAVGHIVDEDGFEDTESLKPKDPRAEAFCALGALRRVNTKHEKQAQKFLERAAAEELGILQPAQGKPKYKPFDEDIFNVNDRANDKENHRRVLHMFTRAIRLAKQAGARR